MITSIVYLWVYYGYKIKIKLITFKAEKDYGPFY